MRSDNSGESRERVRGVQTRGVRNPPPQPPSYQTRRLFETEIRALHFATKLNSRDIQYI